MKKLERIDKLRNERRVKLYVITKEVLWGIFAQAIGDPEYTYGASGIPKDAVIDNVGWDFQHNGVVYRVLHESFEPVKEGTVALYQEVMITVKRKVMK